MRIPVWRLSALLLLGACAVPAPTPPPPVVDVAMDPEEARATVIRELEARGFRVRSQTATDLEAVLASHPPLGYAECPRVRTRAPDSDGSQRRLAVPVTRATTVRVQLVPASSGTRLVIVAAHAEQQRDTLNNRIFTVICTTTGRLERELADSLAK